MKVAQIAVLLAMLLLACITAQAQVAPSCDVTCSPNPNDPGYGGLLASRVMKQNARGTHNTTVAMVGGHLKVPMIPGSQSYNKAIPILSLPGRGLDLNRLSPSMPIVISLATVSVLILDTSNMTRLMRR
jgi:hypothetical protein